MDEDLTWSKRWVKLQPEHLVTRLKKEFYDIEELYYLLVEDNSSRTEKFRTIMAILNKIAMTHSKSISKTEFADIIIQSVLKIPGKHNPFNKFDLIMI